MIFGDVLRVVEDGFMISKTAMERIGVFDQSVCWGVWVHDPRDTTGRKLPHLLISPSHPSVWPYLLRCKIKLRHAPGSMAKAAEILVRNDVNIQFGECAPSGHHHATWNLVAEAVAVRRSLYPAFEKALARRDPEKRRTFSNRLASRMFEFESILRDALVDAHKAMCTEEELNGEGDCGFLHNRVVGYVPLFYDPRRIRRTPNSPRRKGTPGPRELAVRALPEAVSCRWMQNLAYFSIYGQSQPAVRFQYHEADATLRLAQGGDLTSVVQAAFGYTRGRTREYIPSRALAYIQTTEQSLRVEFVPRSDVLNKFVKMRVDYAGKFQAAGDAAQAPGAEDTTRGLWFSLCRELADAEVDLVKIANRTTLRDTGQENGAITLIGRTSEAVKQPWLNRTQRKLQTSCTPAALQDCEVTPWVERLPHYNVFISRRSRTPGHDHLIRIVEQLSGKWGLDPVIVKDPYGRRLTEEIERKMRASAGLFQLIAFSEEEKERFRKRKSGVTPDLRWLLYEYGLAGGLNLPRVRMVDRSTWSQSQWKEHLRTDQDDTLVEFSLDDDDEAVTDAIDRALRSLAAAIARRRR